MTLTVAGFGIYHYRRIHRWFEPVVLGRARRQPVQEGGHVRGTPERELVHARGRRHVPATVLRVTR